MGLTGRHALVTGVSRREGIGFATARQLAALGAPCRRRRGTAQA
jgi:NAD(P)-dependent dehydrogenase (short-subunit alcohol dehydrogenase family)